MDYQYIGLNLRDPVLGDVRVRRRSPTRSTASAIVEYLRRGLATPADRPAAADRRGRYDPDVTSYHPRSGAGASAARRGRLSAIRTATVPLPRLRLTLKVSNIEFNRLQSAVIQQDLARVGIALDVRTYEFATLYADVLSGNFQLFTLQWAGGALADPDILRRVFHSAGAAGRLQPRPLQQRRGRRAARRGDRVADRARRLAALRRGPADRRARRAVHQPVAQDQLRDRAAIARPAFSLSPTGRLPFPQGCRARSRHCVRLTSACSLACARRRCRQRRARRRVVRSGAALPDACRPSTSSSTSTGRGTPGRSAWRRSPRMSGVRLAPTLGVPRQPRTHVVLADQTELANGWATPLPYNTIVDLPPRRRRAPSSSATPTTGCGSSSPTSSRTSSTSIGPRLGADRPRRVRPDAAGVSQPVPARLADRRPGDLRGERLTRRGRLHAGDFRAIEREAARARALEPLDRVNGGLTDWPGGSRRTRTARLSRVPRQRTAPKRSPSWPTTARRVPFFTARRLREVYGNRSARSGRTTETTLLTSVPESARPAWTPRRGSRITDTTLPGRGFFRSPAHLSAEIVYSVRTPHGFPALNARGARRSRATADHDAVSRLHERRRPRRCRLRSAGAAAERRPVQRPLLRRTFATGGVTRG